MVAADFTFLGKTMASTSGSVSGSALGLAADLAPGLAADLALRKAVDLATHPAALRLQQFGRAAAFCRLEVACRKPRASAFPAFF